MSYRRTVTMKTAIEPSNFYQRAVTWFGDAFERALHFGPFGAKDPALTRLFSDSVSTAGVRLHEGNLMSLSAVWCGVTLIGDTVGTLPLITYRRLPTGGKERATDHRLYDILANSPNDEMGSATFRSTLVMEAIVWGNGFAYVQRDQVYRPVALWPIQSSRVRIARDEQDQLVYEVAHGNGTITSIKPADMIHLVGPSADGVNGYNLATVARESLSVPKAMQEYSANYFEHGATMGGFLTYPGALDPLARQAIRESVEKRHRGVGNAHRLGLLEHGLTFTPNTANPEQSQLVDSRQFELAEVARWLRLPPHKLRVTVQGL